MRNNFPDKLSYVAAFNGFFTGAYFFGTKFLYLSV
ncbi:hypothetical protein SAMN04488121_106234 [Chitinophaga filiformis]|uniref:Uncharacterized protein n=1 Tax=Chitinophaga filiformis TaxID=104663 RepID=A0A1G7WZK0_CHIFI|nr:hypothetical protein SAMN04488121_106234 [Chitinophaga filiformis]